MRRIILRFNLEPTLLQKKSFNDNDELHALTLYCKAEMSTTCLAKQDIHFCVLPVSVRHTKTSKTHLEPRRKNN